MAKKTQPAALADLVPAWLSWLKIKNHRPRGVATYQKELGYVLAALGAGATVADWTWEKLSLHLAELVERDISPASIGKRIAAARSFGSWMRKAGHLDRDPAQDLDRPRRAKSLPRPLTTTESRGLWSLMQTPIEQVAPGRRWPWQRNMRILALGLLAGMRLSEIAALTWRDCDLEAGIIRVVAGKGGKDRTIPIAAQLRPFLEAVPEYERRPRHAVAGRRDGRCLSHKSVCHTMDRFVRLALPDVSMHRLRHSFASSLYSAGADLFVLQDLLGHEDPNTTRIYVRVDAARLAAAVEKLPDFGADGAPASIEALRGRFTQEHAPGEAIICAGCGASVPQRKTRQLYCSVRCGQRHRRALRKGGAE